MILPGGTYAPDDYHGRPLKAQAASVEASISVQEAISAFARFSASHEPVITDWGTIIPDYPRPKPQESFNLFTAFSRGVSRGMDLMITRIDQLVSDVLHGFERLAAFVTRY